MIYVGCIRAWSILAPLQNPADSKIAPQIDQVAPKRCTRVVGWWFVSRLVKRWNIEKSQVDWIFVLCVSLFVLSSFSGTVVWVFMFFYYYFFLEQIGPSKTSGRQHGTQTQPSGAKLAPFYVCRGRVSAFLKPSAPKTPPKRPEFSFVMICGPFQTPFWVIPTDSRHRVLDSIVVFARSATHITHRKICQRTIKFR